MATTIKAGPSGVPTPIVTPSDVALLSNPALFDAFGRLRVSNPSTILDVKQVYDDAPLVFVERLAGTGTATYTQPAAATRLSTGGTAPGAAASRQTKRYLNYKSGKSQLVDMTFCAVGGVQAGAVKRVGLFDDANGIFFSIGSAGLALTVRKGGADSEVIQQADWNLDCMDGTGPSGFRLDPAACQILVIDFQWLGVGRVRVGFSTGAGLVYCHEFLHASRTTSVYMQTPNLPMRWEVENTGTPSAAAELDQICGTVISEGGQEPVGIERVAMTARAAPAIASANSSPVVSIRLNAAHLRATVIPRLASLMSSTGGNIRWILQINPTVTPVLAGAWVTDSGSAIEHNTTMTGSVAEDGIAVAGGFFSNNQDASGLIPLSSVLALASDYAGVPDVLVLSASNASAGANESVFGLLQWRELT